MHSMRKLYTDYGSLFQQQERKTREGEDETQDNDVDSLEDEERRMINHLVVAYREFFKLTDALNKEENKKFKQYLLIKRSNPKPELVKLVQDNNVAYNHFKDFKLRAEKMMAIKEQIDSIFESTKGLINPSSNDQYQDVKRMCTDFFKVHAQQLAEFKKYNDLVDMIFGKNYFQPNAVAQSTPKPKMK